MYSRRATRKSVLLVSIMFIVSLSMASVRTATAQETWIKVKPGPEVTLGPDPYPVGTEFVVNITIYDVANLYGWEVKLFWDNSLLNCTDEEYPIFPEGVDWEDPNNIKLGPGIEQDYNTTHGRWYHGFSALPVSQPYPKSFNGTTNLVTLTFNVTDLGVTTLDLQETKLSDPDATPITHNDDDSTVTIIPEFPAYLILSLFFIGTLVAVVLGKKVWSRKRGFFVAKPST